ncbi:MAG: methionine gamma-lyase family protein [Tenericutes bacterium]|nr:methionine gamma-lyase family protein [Mycoplasmatota bacterium]
MDNYEELGISDKALSIVREAEEAVRAEFEKIDDMAMKNSLKVLTSFHKNNVSECHFNGTTGYGYNDIGRDKIEDVFRDVLGAEDALVRNQFISGSHALTVCFNALLRPGDRLLSISGKPYDTLDEVIGIRDNPSSLKSYGVSYDQIELENNDFRYDDIRKYLENNKVRVIEIQRSRGYSTRSALDIFKIEKVIKLIKKVDSDVIVMIDNCYCELVEEVSPLEVGADVIVGSLIKNLGGGIASNGAYIAGRKNLVSLCAERLTVPGCGKEVGPSLGANKQFLQGLYMAPNAVASSLKTAVLTSYVMKKLGFDVEPAYNDPRVDIVQTIIFNDSDKLVKFTQGIQEASAIDSNVAAIPSDMPGYDSQVIMASGSFTQGSSIEISCDGPLRSPYIAYMQGGLTYQYGKLALLRAISKLLEE